MKKKITNIVSSIFIEFQNGHYNMLSLDTYDHIAYINKDSPH